MSDLIRCPECEMPYLPGEASFCGNCGTKLPDQSKVINHISKIENAARPYNALRFVSALIIAGGWAVIIGGWIFALLSFTLINSIFQHAAGDEGPYFVQTFPSFVPLIAGFGGTLFGLMIIGAGQVYAAILDIRDDMNTTMQYVRYGLKRSETNK